MMNVFEHEHPLKLIDLQVNDKDVEESDDEEEEKDLVIQDEFVCPCKRCGQVITEYHKCILDDSCDYNLHKFCAELPTTLTHISRPHPLTLTKAYRYHWNCIHCGSKHKPYEVSLQNFSHQHELILVDTQCIDTLGPTSSKINSLIMCHNPMKKIQLLCNGCLRPITEMPFYQCGVNEEDEGCNFALHEWCTRLPTKDNHPGHPKHTLVLMSNVPHKFLNIFECDVCCLPCNGYAYGCNECKYYVDVTCGFMPEKITHKSHPNHLLLRVQGNSYEHRCLMCQSSLDDYSFSLGYYSYSEFQLGYSCSICDVYIHSECALLLPQTIRHTIDKHPMHLSYLPIENHKSEYFCEICENELNPHSSFYHCDECVQSVHSACAPLILRCETETYSGYGRSIYIFSNVKFGSIHKSNGHPHPLLFVQGIASDGRCSRCSQKLQYHMIFKCTKCEFVIHIYCYERLNNL
ncbi:hypothetical protein L1987_69751 [Smallanthus sonchifolius]|uniref:Uncharacterized protein n=1 Tax=Smallanthus sonchifolius TaxID=185202 RepID=A0ACB9B5V5_9ASTR|nr:hypothetical protein L1987_69751 [Smallanthus sonchifolius]